MLGERLRAARKDRGLGQAELADRVGVRPLTLWRYEAGKVARPQAELLLRLATELGVSVEFLLTGEERASAEPA